MNFTMVDAYCPYIAIVARPWLHTMEVVSSTLHLKVKYPSRRWVEELKESDSLAKKCMLDTTRQQTEGESSASAVKDL